jgi:hypothetical protein
MSFLVVTHLYHCLPGEDFHTAHAHLSYMLDIKPRPIYEKKAQVCHTQDIREYYVTYSANVGGEMIDIVQITLFEVLNVSSY